MRFVFKCWAIEHTSGRVTLTPLDQPELAVHAPSLAQATEELTLVLDDKIARLHPRHLPKYAQPPAGEAIALEVPVLPAAADPEQRQALRLGAVVGPAQKPYCELRLPRSEVRVWLPAGSPAQVRAAAQEYLRAELAERNPSELLAMRAEGRESLVEIAVDVTTLELSALRPGELHLDERPSTKVVPAPGEEEDDWADDAARKRRRKRPAKPRRPETPTLERVATPWHRFAVEGKLDTAFEREALIEQVMTRLGQARPEPLLLVGPAGVGKTAILHEVARRLNAGLDARAEPERFEPVFFLDGARLIAGQGFFGDWQQQVLAVCKEAAEAKVTVSLGHVIDLLDAGKSAHSDQNVAQVLVPALAAGELRIVGEATPEEWARVQERRTEFARLFNVIQVEDPPADALQRILVQVARRLEELCKVVLEPAALEEARTLCARLLPYGAVVGNAVSFLRRLALRERPLADSPRLGRAEVVAAFAAETGVPEVLLRDDVPLDGRTTRAFLRARVKGQEAAVDRAAEVVSVIKANLSERRRPVSVLLFAGPTGVGKTELSKALAALIFGSAERLVRLDMGEYGGPDALARLLGEPGLPGHLTSSLRRQPFSLVLLDEIEKAHPAVFDALLGVFGEGRLTDATGRTTDFRNAIFVLTSNLGADTLRARPGFGGPPGLADVTAHYRSEVRRFFRPELFNRLDDVVVFSPLGAREIEAIVSQELARISRREGLTRRDLELAVDEAACAHLAERGLDPRFGARPLKRSLERALVAPVASYLVAHPGAGPTRLEVTVEAGALAFRSQSIGHAEATPRAAVQRILDRAASVRAAARRWQRSPAVTRLVREITLFDRESRHPAFWVDRALAEERARTVAAGRELVEAFARVAARSLTVEDVAYEAFFARSSTVTAELVTELDEIEGGLEPLGERLYCALFGKPGPVLVTVLPSRGAWQHALWLASGYQRWAGERGVQPVSRLAFAEELPPDREPRGRPLAERPAQRRKAKLIWRWRAAELSESVVGAALSLQLDGLPAAAMLSAEHGAHRFTSQGTTRLVRVHVEPGARAHVREERPEDWDQRQPQKEIRHVWPEKGVVKDLRLGTSHEHPDAYDPAALLRLHVQRRIFREEES